jgi:uncharacterized protein YndB with AHSA1/START domain
MVTENLIATAHTSIAATAAKVWEALTDPAIIKQYMFGAEVVSEWKENAPITWKGEYKGRDYEDKGKILQIEPGRNLRYTHFSELSGQDDNPENYHTVNIDLEPQQDETLVKLWQDKNDSEEARKNSEENWQMMLDALKQVVERGQ